MKDCELQFSWVMVMEANDLRSAEVMMRVEVPLIFEQVFLKMSLIDLLRKFVLMLYCSGTTNTTDQCFFTYQFACRVLKVMLRNRMQLRDYARPLSVR